MRTVIGQTKKNEDAEESDKNRGRVEPYYITCMTITILGAVLAVVSVTPEIAWVDSSKTLPVILKSYLNILFF